MALQSVGYSLPTTTFPLQLPGDASQNASQASPSGTGLPASLSLESYSDSKYDLEFTSSDGDKVSLSLESVQYQQTIANVNGTSGSTSVAPSSSTDVATFIKNQLKEIKQELVDALAQSIQGTSGNAQQTTGTSNVNVPDYWNAENTSQRIVDFATSFFSAFQGKGQDFLNTIKNAIEQGFKEATDEMGKVPDSVSGLTQDTHDLVMQKLDAWAAENGIEVDQSSGAQSDATAQAA